MIECEATERPVVENVATPEPLSVPVPSVVDPFSECEIESGSRLGPGPHGRTEAHPAGFGTAGRDDEQTGDRPAAQANDMNGMDRPSTRDVDLLLGTSGARVAQLEREAEGD